MIRKLLAVLLVSGYMTHAPIVASAEATDKPFNLLSLGPLLNETTGVFRSDVLKELGNNAKELIDRTGMPAAVKSFLEDTGVDKLIDKFEDDIETMMDSFVTMFEQDNATLDSVLDPLASGLDDTIGRLLGDCNAPPYNSNKPQVTRRAARAAEAEDNTATNFEGEGLLVLSAGLDVVAVESDPEKELSIGGAAGLGFSVGFHLDNSSSKNSSFFYGLGFGLGLGITAKKLTPTPTGQSTGTPGTKSSPFSFFDGSLGFDYFGSGGAFGGFAFSLTFGFGDALFPIPIKDFTLYFSHPPWDCVYAEGFGIDDFVCGMGLAGFGITFLEGPFGKRLKEFGSRQGPQLQSLGTALKEFRSKFTMQMLKAKVNQPFSLSVGEGITLSDSFNEGVPKISDFDRSACTHCPGSQPEAESEAPPPEAVTSRQAEVLGFSEDVSAFMEKLRPVLLEGAFTAPFCLGDCSSNETSISGAGRIGLPSTCDGVEASVQVDTLTAGNILHVATSSFEDEFSNAVVDLMGPLAGLGIKNTKLALTASPRGLELSASGSPLLPAASEDDVFTTVVSGLSDVVVQAKVGVTFAAKAKLELLVGTKPDLSNKTLTIRDASNSIGFAVFVQFSYALRDLSPTTRLGITLPLTLCVENCEPLGVSSRYLYLSGDLSLVLSDTGPQVNGDLKMDGWWFNALGISFLHIGNIVVGVGASLQVPLVPTRLVLGGAACLGREYNCKNNVGPFIKASAYVGVSASVPADNYFIVMVTELTIGNLVDIVLQDGSDFPPLPDVVRLSGLYPFDAAATDGCGMQQDSNTSDVAQLNMKCFAYIYFNPSSAKREIAFQSGSGSIEIEKGVGFQGKLNFLGWQIKLKVAVSSSQFLVDGEMDLVDLKIGDEPFLRIGKELDTTNKAVGGAKFLIDLKGLPNPSALIEIAGAFDIPLLDSYGYVAITLTNEIFSFSAGITLFGGVLSTHAMVEWDWALTYFKMSLDDIQFIGGVVTLKKLVFQYDKNLAFARFDAAISVLWFLSFELFVDVKGDRIGFGFTLDVLGAATTIDGTAVVANPFANSEFDVMVTCSFNPDTLEEIGEDINQIVQDVAQFAEKAWANVSAKVEELWNDIKEIFSNGLSAIGGAITGLLEDVQAFLKDAAAALKDVPVLGKLLELGSLLAEGDVDGFLKGLGSALGLFGIENKHVKTTGAINAYGCPVVKKTWTECVKIGDVKLWCTNMEGDDEYAEPKCMEEKAELAVQVEEDALNMQKKQETIENSKKKNPGLNKVASGGTTIPKPSVQPTKVAVPYGTNKASASGTTSMGVRVLGGAGSDGNVESGETSSSEVNAYDLSSEAAYEQSLEAVKQSIGKNLAAKALSKQEGLENDPDIQGEAGLVTYGKPELHKAEDKEIACDSALNVTSFKPKVKYIDPLCKSGAKVVVKKVEPLSSTGFPDRICGSSFVRVYWQLRDASKCGGKSELVPQIITILPSQPELVFVPSDINITTQDSIDFRELGGPARGRSKCSQEFDITYEDSVPDKDPSVCNRWTIRRTWQVLPFFADANCVPSGKKSAEAVQVITIDDNTAPKWTLSPEPEAVVPFFNNFQEQVTIPSAHETATDVMLNLGLTLYPTQLTSEDGPLTLFPTTSGESLCRVNGLAQFTRTWRAQDKCGNTRTAVQIITVMHPPTTLAETKTLRPLPAQDFSYAPGITQLADRCNAGKKVELGIKHYNPLDNTDDTDACGVGVWSPVGCRRLNAAVREVSVVHSVPPVFATFPDDITINTTHSLNPKSGLGEPVGGAYCGTPFHIWFADAPPVLQKCGEWTIERTWKIQPHYKDCGLGDVYPNSLTTVRVQVITVRDISPPAWLFKPQAPVSIPFFQNYRETNSIPLTEEQAHPDMIALGLVSYPTTTTSSDGSLVLSSTAASEEATCRERGLAEMVRTWTTTDRCGNMQSFEQVITIEHPPETLLGVQPFVPTDRLFSYTPGVTQLMDACHPGKKVVVGGKDFVPLDNETSNNACASNPWDEDACRRIMPDPLVASAVNTHSIPPFFTTFPDDITINTTHSLDPKSGLGEPVGSAYCGTPFHIWFADAPPVLQKCGEWTIKRSWKIQPHYKDCGLGDMYPNSLTTMRVQVITVLDIFAPEFIEVPEQDQPVIFLTDYGPTVMGVPLVEDIATHKDMSALNLVSYNVTLKYTDVTRIVTDTASSCIDGLAVVDRTWTTADRCGNTGTWDQTIRVLHPRHSGALGLAGNASGIQLFSFGGVGLTDVVVGGALGSNSDIGMKRAIAGTVVAAKPIFRNNDGQDAHDDHDHCNGPVEDFPNAVDELTDFSEALRTLPNLRTGPKLITCTAPQQNTCGMTMHTPETITTVTIDSATDTATLEGDGQLYNIFSIPLNDWMIKTPQPPRSKWGRKKLPAPEKPKMFIRAGGFVIVNIDYPYVDRQKDTLRDTVFQFPSAGSEFVLYNMKQTCSGSSRHCKYHNHNHWLFPGHWHHHFYDHRDHHDHDYRKGYHSYHIDFKNVTIHGSLITQDDHIGMSMTDSDVYCQVLSAGHKMEVEATEFHCSIFASNTRCGTKP